MKPKTANQKRRNNKKFEIKSENKKPKIKMKKEMKTAFETEREN